MQRVMIKAALCATMLCFSACTPFFYGGVVVFGPAQDATPAETGKDQATP